MAKVTPPTSKGRYIKTPARSSSNPLVMMECIRTDGETVKQKMTFPHASEVLNLQRFVPSKNKWTLDPADTNYNIVGGKLELKTPALAPAPALAPVPAAPPTPPPIPKVVTLNDDKQ